MIQSLNRSFPLVILLGAFLLPPSDLLAQQAEVKVFAHRGGAHEYDENTMQAFQESYAKGIRGYETDIRITKDGHLVIFHDADLKRIVGKEGPIESLTLDEVKQLRTKKGNPIPTLDEVLAFFSDKPGVYIEFEMKTDKPMYDENTLTRYCDELHANVYASRPATSEYLLTSFDKRPLQYLKKTYPSADLLFIKSTGLSREVLDEAKELGVSRVACNISNTTRAMVQEAKKQGFKVSLWPGRSVADFLLGVSLGSDYLCSDVPVQVTEWVKANAPHITLR